MNFIKTTYCTEGETILLCPVCNMEYTHLAGVVQGSDQREGRMNVSLTFTCEDGHQFEYCLNNQKGYTVSTVEQQVNADLP